MEKPRFGRRSGSRKDASRSPPSRAQECGLLSGPRWPGLGWRRIVRTAWALQIDAASHLRLSLEDDPDLVPLETLPGRDFYDFPPGDDPPWHWSIVSRPSGRPFG